MNNPKIGDVNYEIQVHSNFYFYFLSLININFTNKVQTAGLILEGVNFEVNINPEYWKSISIGSRLYEKNQFLLLHELYHIILKHYRVYKDYDDFTLFNIATDMYINEQLINDIFKSKSFFPEGGIWYEDDRSKVPLNIVKEGSDSIYFYLKNSKDDNFKDFYNSIKESECSVVIDHDLWKLSDGSGVSDEILKKSIEAQINKILTEANKLNKNQGNIPSFLRKLLDELLSIKESKINWKKELSNFVNLFSNKIFIKKSYTKPSKFFEDVTTFKVKFKPKIAVIIDTSGSMGGEGIKDAFSELVVIGKKSDLDIIVVECDAQVTEDSIYEYKGFDALSKRLISKGYVGGGGTIVDPAIAYINKNCKDVASIIYLTDGYVSPSNVNPLKPMIVVLTSNGDTVQNFSKKWGKNFKILKID